MTEGSATSRHDRRGDLSALAVWIVCTALYAALMALVFYAPGVLRGPGIDTEQGLVEQLQNVTLFIALVLAVLTFLRAKERPLRIWLALIALGLIYLLGEEISWGQHYFGWSTTGIFERFNDQGETNFHNTAGGWLDQKPRAILLFGMILGAIVHPLVKWARNGRGLFDNPWWLAPTLASLAPVVFSQIGALPKRLNILDLFRWSEMEELFMYVFFITYTLSLFVRLKASRQAPS